MNIGSTYIFFLKKFIGKNYQKEKHCTDQLKGKKKSKKLGLWQGKKSEYFSAVNLISAFKVFAKNNCGSNNRLRYSIQDQPLIRNFFNIDDQTGTICLGANLDFETTAKYQFVIEASDFGKLIIEIF